MSAVLPAHDSCQSEPVLSTGCLRHMTLLLEAHDSCQSESLNSKNNAASCVFVLCCMLKFARALRCHQSHRHVTAASQVSGFQRQCSLLCFVLCFLLKFARAA